MKYIHIAKKMNDEQAVIVIVNKENYKNTGVLNKQETEVLKKAIDNKKSELMFNQSGKLLLIAIAEASNDWETSEKLRRTGASFCSTLNKNSCDSVCVAFGDKNHVLSFVEGLALSNYQFLKYKTKPANNSLKNISVLQVCADSDALHTLDVVLDSTFLARDLVNEPHSFLTSVQISEEFKKIAKQAGFKIEVWNEAKIEAQKMGGILAVNKASRIPPTFNIMEYKPNKAINKKPYVLVGKGVVYDTGGLSLKPTPMSMDHMKCDMAGAALVVGVLNAVAKLELPIHVVGLVPATDNWIGENSYAPGDVITMYSGTTVEILNTDAEGRLILADALHFAKKLKPELVCDFATLTGAAVRAIGPYATAVLGTADDNVKKEIFESSYAVFERLVEFPLWQEYADELKSEIADMTNLGKGEGGQISAAKFLQHFTDYPWMHFDIAGPAFNHAPDAYKPKGGTGVGVRLMIDFLMKQAKSKAKK